MTAVAEKTKSTCPTCGAPATGKFCSECGTTLGLPSCASCGAGLIDGAKFCHRCGLAAGSAAPPNERRAGSGASMPWIVAAIALLAFIALIAGQKFGANRPEPAADDQTAQVPASVGPGRAPDISQMSPAERAIRLHNRILTFKEAGKQDSVMMFAPMGIAAFEMLGNLDVDSRYDLGMIGWASDNVAIAKAQADTILQQNKNHLLGLILAARAAQMENKAADERGFYQRLVAAEASERPKALPEYVTHDNDIVLALDEARRVVRR
jgi:hypothetical protein